MRARLPIAPTANPKDEATKEVREHPQQVKEGEQFAEKKLGLDGQDDQSGQDDQGKAPQEEDTGR